MWLKFLALFVGIAAITLSFYFEKKVEESKSKKAKKEDESKRFDDDMIKSDDFDFEDFRDRLLKKEEKSYDKEAINEDINRLVTKKMVELNEFSEQLLESIETNHKEVMFLYDMLSKKEDELKDFLDNDFEEKKESIIESSEKKESIEDRSVFNKNQAYMINKDYVKDEYNDFIKNISFEEKEELNSAFRQNSINENFYYEDEADTTIAPSQNDENANVLGDLYSEIIEMKKQGMNNVDISKELQLGTGEVNLILNLYKSKIV